MPTRKIKKIHIIILAIIVVIASGELFARYYLGLGTPPLSIAHPKIEYMFKPNQDIYRFGNHIIINNYGMRTFPFHKQPAANEFRIMIFGDSVLNGGSLTDHTQLATTILQKKLAKIERKVLVGNISAGSWGPGNWLAYAKEYGFFKANVIVLLISSHDYTDNPTFQPLNKNTHPTKTPVSALIEGITRYLPRYLPQFTTNQSHHVIKKKTREQKALKGLKDLKDFLILAKNNSKYIFVFQHWDKKEIKKGFANPGNKRIQKVCKALGISPISLKPYFSTQLKNNNPYYDNIHLNQIGQQLIAKAFFEHLHKILKISAK